MDSSANSSQSLRSTVAIRSVNPLHAFLRDHVASAHRAAEAKNPFLTAPLSKARYLQLMFRLEMLWFSLETSSLAFGQLEVTLGLSAHPYRRLHHLRADLDGLGLRRELLEQARIMPQTIVFDWLSALGCLYVLVGSRLGGGVIGRHIRRQLSEQGQAASDFWLADAKHAASDLNRLLAAIHRHSLSDLEKRKMAESSQKTFALYSAWIHGAGPRPSNNKRQSGVL